MSVSTSSCLLSLVRVRMFWLLSEKTARAGYDAGRGRDKGRCAERLKEFDKEIQR